MRSTPSLRSFPHVAFETVRVFVRLSSSSSSFGKFSADPTDASARHWPPGSRVTSRPVTSLQGAPYPAVLDEVEVVLFLQKVKVVAHAGADLPGLNGRAVVVSRVVSSPKIAHCETDTQQ